MDIPGHRQQHVPAGNTMAVCVCLRLYTGPGMCINFELSLFSLYLVCHVLLGALLQKSERRTESNQTSGQIPLCENGGVCLFLVIICV